MDIENITSLENLASRISTRGLAALLRVIGSLGATLELSEVLQIAIENSVEIFGVDTGAIYTLENNDLYLGATTPPLPPNFPEELRIAKLDEHPHIQKTIKTKQPLCVPQFYSAELSIEERKVVETRNLVSVIFFPLLLRNEAIGVYMIGTTEKEVEVDPEDMDLAYILSAQASLAITNAKLFDDVQNALTALFQAYNATLEGWSQMLNARDKITDEHTNRVIELTVALAEKMDIPEDDLIFVRWGALLHDIGKMGIPDEILNKPGKLTEEEWAIMKTHPETAYKILSRIEYLNKSLDIPYCHHEKWDGTGYPRQLKGEEIPLAARIFAVIDVYDALTSDRPYRDAWSKEKTLHYIKEQSGKHFSPAVVAAFLELIENSD